MRVNYTKVFRLHVSLRMNMSRYLLTSFLDVELQHLLHRLTVFSLYVF
jgi:hypothetical protein